MSSIWLQSIHATRGVPGHIAGGLALVLVGLWLLPQPIDVRWAPAAALILGGALVSVLGMVRISGAQHRLRLIGASAAGTFPVDVADTAAPSLGLQNALLRPQADSSPVGILAVTLEEDVLLANRAFQELWRSPPEVLRQGHRPLIEYAATQVADPDHLVTQLVHLREHPDTILREDVRMKDGRVFDCYSAPLLNDEGACTGRIFYHSDVTDRRQLADELTQAKLRYEAAIEASGQVLFDWSVEGGTATWAGCCEAMLGYTAEELFTGVQSVLELIHPDDVGAVREALERAQRTRCPIDIEFRIRRKDGVYIEVKDRARFLRSGRELRMIGFLADISNERRAGRALAASERFSRAVVDALSSAVAILDACGAVLAVNVAWTDLLRDQTLPQGHIGVGDNLLAACDAAEGDEAAAAQAAAEGIRAVVAGQKPEFYLESAYGVGDAERCLAMRVTRFEAGSETRLLLSYEDITGRRMTERLEREKAGLREAVAAMEKVLGVVGHELRTPLAALRALSEFLMTDGARDTAEWEQFMGDIGQEVDRMADTVNNLLEAARINSGRARWNWGTVCTCEVCGDALESIRPLIDPRRVMLSLDLDSGGCRMNGDAEALRRLITNLLANARKHTQDGHIGVTVRSTSDQVTGVRWIHLAVHDTGGGIPPEVCDRLGEAFALNSGIVGANFVSGTGLGLAICKGIAAAHGGELRVETVEGRGTTVTATLRADLDRAAEGDSVPVDELELIPS